MFNLPNLVHIGQVAVFYLPESKFEVWCHEQQTALNWFIHAYLINHFDAYTMDQSDKTIGYWRESKDHTVVRDLCYRFEVSFGGKDKIPGFIDFLSEVCELSGEKAIYLTMGKHSYHVLPKGINEVRKTAPECKLYGQV